MLMPWWIKYPNVNNEIQNLDWLLEVSNRNTDKIENFVNLNTIKYANPILWNIESQYEANTIVVDGQTGNAYISVKPVPAGVSISRTEYWLEIYNYSEAINNILWQLAFNEGNRTTSQYPHYTDDYIIVSGVLYRVVRDINAGDAFVNVEEEPTGNIGHVSVGHELTTIKKYMVQETTDRADADTALSNRINDEADARSLADNNLSDRINNEAIARGTADTALQNQIDAINGEYIVWIGDSYTGAASLGPNITQRYSTQVSAMLGLQEKNYAVGGSGFIVGNRTYDLQVQDAIDDFTSNNLDKTKVKYFVIGGTRNDGVPANANDYVNGVRTVLTMINNNFTNAEIIILPMLWDASCMPIEYLETIKRLKQAALYGQSYKVRIIDYCYTWLNGMYQYILYQDGANVHPDIRGHYILAKEVYNAIKGSPYCIDSYVELPAGGFSPGLTNCRFTVDKCNNMQHIHIQFTVSDASAIVGNKIFEHTFTLAYVEEFFIGNYRTFFNFDKRTATHPSQPAYVECMVNKTGDETGSMYIDITCYSQALSNGETYYIDLVQKLGVIENKYIIT